jgi:hypothetical protein
MPGPPVAGCSCLCQDTRGGGEGGLEQGLVPGLARDNRENTKYMIRGNTNIHRGNSNTKKKNPFRNRTKNTSILQLDADSLETLKMFLRPIMNRFMVSTV